MINEPIKHPEFNNLFPECQCKNGNKNFDFADEYKLVKGEKVYFIHAYCRNCSRRTEDLISSGLSWNETKDKLVEMWVKKYE